MKKRMKQWFSILLIFIMFLCTAEVPVYAVDAYASEPEVIQSGDTAHIFHEETWVNPIYEGIDTQASESEYVSGYSLLTSASEEVIIPALRMFLY